MSRTIFLDAGPLWILTMRPGVPVVDDCNDWLAGHLRAGSVVVVPEIADYEVRRELVRTRKAARVRTLDSLKSRLVYLPITTPAMLRAADIWAAARQRGQPTAGDKNIDSDVIQAAQAQLYAPTGGVIATTNVGHISRYYPAELWSAIAP